jgi:hypothetical protein
MIQRIHIYIYIYIYIYINTLLPPGSPVINILHECCISVTINDPNWHITINQRLYLIQMSLVFVQCSILGSNLEYHLPFSLFLMCFYIFISIIYRGGSLWHFQMCLRRANVSVYFVYMHENRTKKPVEIVLKKGNEGKWGGWILVGTVPLVFLVFDYLKSVGCNLAK